MKDYVEVFEKKVKWFDLIIVDLSKNYNWCDLFD